MLGQCATSGATSSENRIFVYEVTGLRQNEVTASRQSPIRSSHRHLIQVPFHRMGEEMRRITMLGGKVVNIRPLAASEAEPSTAAPDAADEA
ncbi:MAG: phycobilisome linker polypeptide [Leptolyngbya sp. SIO4C1]|nr:phycobilisome linker polypeptide [Leptolyngbya sp. SIO4C1]